jgi:hypothetical protein
LAVWKRTTLVNFAGILTAIGSTGNDWNNVNGFSFEAGTNSPSVWEYALNHQGFQLRATDSITSFAVVVGTRDGTAQNLYYKGANATTTTSGTAQSTSGTMTVFGVGGRTSNGALEAGSRLNGDIAYLTWLPSLLTTPQRRRIESSAALSFKIACS